MSQSFIKRLPRHTFNWQGPALILLLALIWEMFVATRVIDFETLAAPSAVLSAGAGIFSNTLLPDTLHTLSSTLSGWAIGSVIGIVVGLWFGISRVARRFAMATAEIFRAAPGIAFVPVVILIFGFTLQTEIVTVAYVSIWPVLINAVAGASAVTPLHVDVSKTLHLSRSQTITKIMLPASVPYIVTGLKLSLSTALALAVVTEMIGNPSGLGYDIILFSQALQPASMLAVIIWVGILGILLNMAFDRLSLLLPPVRANRTGA